VFPFHISVTPLQIIMVDSRVITSENVALEAMFQMILVCEGVYF
jgi:hypothetical protein